MQFKIIREDIARFKCDAIVNASNVKLLASGGVDGAIHKAGGKRLDKACEKLGGCEVGEAKITKGYNLPCKYVIHTVGPVWQGGDNNEESLLKSCYENSLKLASAYKCKSVALPLISSGSYGYPKPEALQVAVDVISAFLENEDMMVYLVVFDKDSFEISENLFQDIKSFVDDRYVNDHFSASTMVFGNFERQRFQRTMPPTAPRPNCKSDEDNLLAPESISMPSESLEDMLNCIDESFSQMLMRKIDEKGMTDSQCYKKANVDRKLFSKIHSNVNYKPKKTTAIAFAIALELDFYETQELLRKAGFTLSHSNKFDIIIEYFILNENYNIFEINAALFKFDQVLLGV